MLKFYHDAPGLAWDVEEEHWVRVDEKNTPIKSATIEFESEQKMMAELVSNEGPSRVEHFLEHWTAKTGETKTTAFGSEFSKFDEKMGGIETGEIVVISGQRKNGKTLFAESWIRSMIKKNPNAKAMYLSFEVQTHKLFEKYLDSPALPIYTPRTLVTMDFEWLKKRCLEAKLKFGCNILMIDHLHFMVDMNTKQNMSLNIGAFMRRLKQEIAIGLEYAVILIAHQGQLREGQGASINSIRDSSFIAQESDATIIVSRRKNFDPGDLDKLEKSNITKYERYCQKAMAMGEEKEIGDPYSMGLALVSIEVNRRTGCYEYKKTFQKIGNFLEEL